MANQVGKRYKCAKCGAEVIVTRGGNGTVTMLRPADGTKEIEYGRGNNESAWEEIQM